MRKEVIERTLYQFNELSEKAKEEARSWYREGLDFSFEAEIIIEDATYIGKLLGLDIKNIYWEGFSYQGNGASFTGRYSPEKENTLEAIKSEFPTDTELHDIAERLFSCNPLTASINQSGRYVHEYTMVITCYNGDDETDGEKVETLEEALKDYARWIYKRLEQHYDYLNSDESIDENITINEYEFLENGKRA